MVDDHTPNPPLPDQCPNPDCGTTTGPFEYDAEFDMWTCTKCAASWRAGVPERRR